MSRHEDNARLATAFLIALNEHPGLAQPGSIFRMCEYVPAGILATTAQAEHAYAEARRAYKQGGGNETRQKCDS